MCELFTKNSFYDLTGHDKNVQNQLKMELSLINWTPVLTGSADKCWKKFLKYFAQAAG